MKQGLVFGFCFIAIVIFAFDKLNESANESALQTIEVDSIHNYQHTLKAKALIAKTYCKSKQYNTTIGLLINYKIHSGLPRLFIWDFVGNKAIDSGLVSHGCGTNTWGRDESKTHPMFSNKEESHCSSVGKYLIKERGYSEWGIHVKYNLQGLEASNSNALKRYIVLHSWEAVGNISTYPVGTPEGWGCPAVSNKFMYKLDSLLQQQQNKKVILWAFND
jgi:hypothetical protein